MDLDLSAFAGQTVDLRFYLFTGDYVLNSYKGFYVDDVVVDGGFCP